MEWKRVEHEAPQYQLSTFCIGRESRASALEMEETVRGEKGMRR